MAMHALVVGSKTAGLEGPIGDAERMATALAELGFQIDLRTTDDQASRAGILAGYEQLIRNVQGDARSAAVFYYSGHGVRVRPADPASATGTAADVPRAIQALVPTDFDRSSGDDFRGILDLELSVLLARLTRATPNATVILDCCHATSMSRGLERPKSLLHPSYVDIARHLRRCEATGFDAGLLSPTGNKDAVRLVAAGQSESAYEREVGNRFVGTFTESLVLALQQARGKRLTWDALGRSVRERVLAFHPSQRADIEGPRRRYLFETDQAPEANAFTVVAGREPRTGVLRAGRLHGVHERSEYAIVPGGATEGAQPVGTATVTRVEAAESAVALQLVPPTTALPPDAQAVLTRSAAPRRAIRLIADGAARDAISKAILATQRFTLCDPDDPSPLAVVQLAGDQLELLSPAGVPVVPASRWPGDSLERLVTNLRMLTAAQALRELASATTGLPDSSIELAWGRVDRGEPVELLTSGELLSVGMRVFLRITNRHRQKRKLYVSVFDIGVAQRIQLLTRSWPAGYELEHRETFTLGQDARGALVGLALGWSSAIPEDFARSESLVVIVTDQPCDLSALETPGAKSLWMPSTRSALRENPLQQLVRQFQYGTTREIITRDFASAETTGHLVRHIDFELSPTPLPARGKAFLLDDRPAESLLLYRRRGVSTRKIAIRITSLVVHDTRALFGSADIRIDTLVVTRSAAASGEPYRAHTLRFQQIRDGEPVPFDNALIYHGDVTDFVDFRVWVSRDRDDAKTLTELLEEQANSSEFREAAGALLTAVATAAVAAPAVVAIGAVATLTAIAWNVLSQALPRSIGLYQTSLLAAEGTGFGAGRHPATGLMRAQGFSFGYEVIAVD